MTIRAFSILTLILAAGVAQAEEAGALSAGLWWLQTTGRGRLVEAPVAPQLDLAPPPRLPAANLTAAHSDERNWYGGQLIASDIISGGLVAAGIGIAGQSCTGFLCNIGNAVPGVALGSLGLAGLTLVAPITHLAHGQGVAALASLALRVGLPLVASFIASQYVRGPLDLYGRDSSNAPAVVGGIALGAGAIIDDAFLSSEPL